MNTKYSCNECANTRTLLCSQCTRISSPSGRERAPSLFLKADGDRFIGDCEDALIALRLERDCGEDPTKKLEDIIKACIKRKVPIPVFVINAYNRVTELDS